MDLIANTGYGVDLRTKTLISAFSPVFLANIYNPEITRVYAAEKDILNVRSVLDVSGNLRFDHRRKEVTTSVFGEGSYLPQTATIETNLRQLSTGQVIIRDVWGEGFLFYRDDVAVIALSRLETSLNLPHGSILAGLVGGSEGILQLNISETNFEERVESWDAFYVRDATPLYIVYNVLGSTDFPVLPTFGGSGGSGSGSS
jgi:hypothetical protein